MQEITHGRLATASLWIAKQMLGVVVGDFELLDHSMGIRATGGYYTSHFVDIKGNFERKTGGKKSREFFSAQLNLHYDGKVVLVTEGTQGISINATVHSASRRGPDSEWWIHEDYGRPYFIGHNAHNRRIEPDMAEACLNGFLEVPPGLCYDI